MSIRRAKFRGLLALSLCWGWLQVVADVAALAQCTITETAAVTTSDASALARFGGGVDLEGDLAIIGAPFAETSPGLATGKAYIYGRDAQTGVWSEKAQLAPSLAAPEDCFGGGASGTTCHGEGVVLSGDVAIVGAHHDDTLGENAGAVYVFRRSAATQAWTEEQKLFASDGGLWHQFGMYLDIQGDTIVVGARGVLNHTGAVYVFRFDGTSWTEETKITPFDGLEGHYFGQGVGILDDLIAVGAQGNAPGGAVYVYRHDGVAWAFEAKLVDPTAEPGDSLGADVEVGAGVIAAGAPGRDTGILGSGAVYIYRHDPVGGWAQEDVLMATEPEQEDYIGYHIAFDGDVVAAGANFALSDPGEVHIFAREQGAWSETAVLLANNPQAGHMGYRAAVDGGRVIAGAPREFVLTSANQGLAQAGTVYFFDIDPGCQPLFRRGDANQDGNADIADAVFLLAALFLPGSPQSVCLDATDSNDDGVFNVADSVFQLAWLFMPSATPLPPPLGACGPDPSSDAVGCESYTACP